MVLGPLSAVLLVAVSADTISLVSGMVITHSVVVRPGSYRLTPPPGDSAIIRVRGSGVVVDFGGAELVGTAPSASPDRARGIGILIEGGSDVTLKRARVRGYRVGLLARRVRGLRLLDNDLSHNWKPRLYSGFGHESLTDWLSFHHNEKDEWLRYGAAIYLDEVDGGEVRGNIARQGMNGLQLVRTNRLRIWNNDFSFNSGLGIGMYRSSDNVVMHNRADYCIRGYVHGVYNRGQDSAALLIYEQSARNVVAYNSMTHGGDGLFLWAGQSTMDSGQGGANDNLFFGNDFSFAATNGIEATFSRNRFVGNVIEGAHHGMWGGYSYRSEVRGNLFRRNTVGIAIEHGQDNAIVANRFEANTTAVRLWWNPIEPSDWGYPKHRDTRSRDYTIADNTFTGDQVALRVENSQRVVSSANGFFAVDTAVVAVGDTAGWSSLTGGRRKAAGRGGARWAPPRDSAAPAPFRDGRQLFPRARSPNVAEGAARGRHTILVDEWGPYDWRSPRLWPARAADSAYHGGPLAMVVVGPPGRWRLVDAAGATISPRTGRVGDTVTVTPSDAGVVDWRVAMVYRGHRAVAPNGHVTEANQPYRFGAERFVAPFEWNVRVFAWDSTADPRRDSVAFGKVLRGVPIVERADRFLDYLWYRPRLPGFPAERFAVVAEGETDLPAGDFAALVISDDAVRVWLDDRLVVDRWEPHESTVDEFPIGPGRHRLKVEYFQVGGWVELRVTVRRTSPG